MTILTKGLTIIVSCILTIMSFTAFADVHGNVQGTLKPAFSSWGKKSVVGDWILVEENGQYFIELADNFSAKSGPDVKVFLSPIKADSVTGKNATEGSVFLVLLNKFKGKTRIAIPVNIDITQYKSLVFHCEEYSKLWGTSSL